MAVGCAKVAALPCVYGVFGLDSVLQILRLITGEAFKDAPEGDPDIYIYIYKYIYIYIFQRVTRMAVEQMKKAQVEDWGVAARKATWTLAGYISRSSDGMWSTELLDWCPAGGGRRVGQPSKRWRDDIERVSQKLLEADSLEEWRIVAESRGDWQRLQDRWLEELARKNDRQETLQDGWLQELAREER